MTERRLQSILGVALVVSHFLLIGLVVALFFAGGFAFNEMTTSVALLAPILASSTAVILKMVISRKLVVKSKTPDISMPYAILSLFLPGFFFFFIASIILLKALNIGFSDFEQFKDLLALGEMAFGAYSGLLIKSLFQTGHEN